MLCQVAGGSWQAGNDQALPAGGRAVQAVPGRLQVRNSTDAEQVVVLQVAGV